jgi:hypothetical protein
MAAPHALWAVSVAARAVPKLLKNLSAQPVVRGGPGGTDRGLHPQQM